jgi:hypothetical protein
MDDPQNEKKTNEDLMCRVTTGDKHAFETLVYRHQRPVLNFIFRFMGDPTEAEDLTQEVFLSVWKSAGTILRPAAQEYDPGTRYVSECPSINGVFGSQAALSVD